MLVVVLFFFALFTLHFGHLFSKDLSVCCMLENIHPFFKSERRVFNLLCPHSTWWSCNTESASTLADALFHAAVPTSLCTPPTQIAWLRPALIVVSLSPTWIKWGVVIATQLALSTKDVSTSSQCCLNRNCPLSFGWNDNLSISWSKTFPMSRIGTCLSQKLGQNLFLFSSKICSEYILWIFPQDISFKIPHLNLHCLPHGE